MAINKSRGLFRVLSLILSLLILPLSGPSLAQEKPLHEPASVNDLFYRNILFYYHQQDYFSAITRLLSARHLGKIYYESEDFELLLADLKLHYGMPDVAQAALEKNRRQSSLEIFDRDHAWFYLAEVYFRQGKYDQAEAALSKSKQSLPESTLEEERQLLNMQILSAQKRHKEAMESFNAISPLTHSSPYWKFNAGIFLLKNAKKEQGLKLMNEVSSLKASIRDRELLALKDHANLVLAQLLRSDKKYSKSSQHSLKIWSDSLLYSQAQWVLGQTMLDKREYKKAVTEWQRMNRQIVDKPVQDALMTIPSIYMEQGDDVATEKAYYEAISVFKQAKKQLKSLQITIQKGKYLDDLYAGQKLTIDTLYLIDKLSEVSLAQAMDNHRHILFLEENLVHWNKKMKLLQRKLHSVTPIEAKKRFQRRMDRQRQHLKSLSERIRQAKQQWKTWVENELIQALNVQKDRLNANLGMALYGLASFHDDQLNRSEHKP